MRKRPAESELTLEEVPARPVRFSRTDPIETLRNELDNTLPRQPFRGATPDFEYVAPAPAMAAAEEMEIVSPIRGPASAATTIVYDAPPSRALSVRNTPVASVRSAITPLLSVPATVVTDGAASAPVRMVGDKSALIEGYKKVSLCHTLAAEAVARARAAAEILDPDHRDQIIGMLQVAGLTNANATSRKLKRIPLKRAISIATKAERWVYQQQAAAAKHAAKEARQCARKLSGRHKLTTAEKNERYQRRYGIARGTKGERAVRKYQRKIAKITGAE